ncbi:hypothetical protein DFH28DRAFT_930950 [Melampsora americana]|nr:hypothetical protein DFH28DRAFT_930950 [Melampsora americana]
MKPSILLYVLCIHIASTSAHLRRFRTSSYDHDEIVVPRQTGRPRRAVDENSNFISHDVYPSSSNRQHQSGININLTPQDSINSWRSDDDPAVQGEIDSNFILRSRAGHTAHRTEDEVHSLVTQQHPSRVPKKSTPAHLMDPSGFVTTPASRVDDHRSGIAVSRKRVHESSSDSSEDESYWPSSSTEQDQSESDTSISSRNSLDSRWMTPEVEPAAHTIHNRESISRNRIKRPAYDNEDRFRPSSSTSHSQLGVNHDLRPPQARDPRQSLNKEVAQVNYDRGSDVRQGIEQPSHYTETQFFSTIPTPNRQIQGHRDDVPPQPMDSERPNTEELIQRADIASRVMNMPQDRSMAREVDEKEVISVLTQTGSTASYLKEGLLQKIEDAYDHIKTYSILENPPSTLSSYTVEELEAAFQKVQIDVVHGFLGGIFSVFAGHPNRPQWSELIDDGWKFLGKYLTQAFFLVPGLSHEAISRGSSIWEDKWSEPTHLFGYILSLDKDEHISPHLILNLLKKWEKVASYKPGTYGIIINYDTFLEACESLEKKRGKSIWKAKPNVQKDVRQSLQKDPISSNQNSLRVDIRSTSHGQSSGPSTQNPHQSLILSNQSIPPTSVSTTHNVLPNTLRPSPLQMDPGFPEPILHNDIPSASNVHQIPTTNIQNIPQKHMTPIQYSPNYMSWNHNLFQHDMRPYHNFHRGNIPSSQGMQHTMSNQNPQLDQMASNYMVPTRQPLSYWEKVQKTPNHIEDIQDQRSGPMMGRVMTKIGKNYLDHHKSFKKEVHQYFEDFRTKIVESMENPIEITPSLLTDMQTRKKKIMNVIKSAEDQITRGYFAALFLIHQTQGPTHPWEFVMRGGWSFLKEYFSQWEMFLMENLTGINLKHPGKTLKSLDLSSTEDIVRYLANHRLKDGSPVSIVWRILEEWSGTIGSSTYGISLSNIDDIKTFYRQSQTVSDNAQVDEWGKRGKNEVQSSRKRKSPVLKLDKNINYHQQEGNLGDSEDLLEKVNSARLSISPEFVDFLKLIWQKDIPNHTHISPSYDEMFLRLQADIMKIFTEDNRRAYSIGQESSSSQGVPVDANMMKSAVLNVQFQLGPAFMGILKLLHQQHLLQQDWELVLQNGLRFLRMYVDPWKDFLKTNKSISWFTKQEKSILDIDWSNVKDVLNYMIKRQFTDVMPVHPLKYLIELWYKCQKSGQAGTIPIIFKTAPPHMSLIEDIYIDYLYKIKGPGHIDLWKFKHEVERNSRKKSRFPPLSQENDIDEDERADADVREVEEVREVDNVVSTGKFLTGHVTLSYSGINIDENALESYGIAKLKTNKEFWNKYQSFFGKLNIEVSAHSKHIQDKNQDRSGRDKNISMYLNVIEVVQNQITPSFMFILFLIHSGQRLENPVEKIWETGWTYLISHFKKWKKYILSKRAPILSVGRRKIVNNIDWSNIPETVKYMATHNVQTGLPSQILTYLIDQWYSTLLDPQGRTVQKLGYQLSPPDGKLIQDEFTRYKTIGLLAQLWVKMEEVFSIMVDLM